MLEGFYKGCFWPEGGFELEVIRGWKASLAGSWLLPTSFNRDAFSLYDDFTPE